MTQSFRNENMTSENVFEVFKNDVMDEECLQEFEINSRLQTKYNQNLESEEKTMKENRRWHVQRTIWKSNGKKHLCSTSFLCE
jgi:hypothetical protein